MSDHNFKEYADKWFVLKRQHGLWSFKCASLLADAFENGCQGHEATFRKFVRDVLGEDAGEVERCVMIVRSFRKIPTRDMWVRLGERGVAILAKIKNETAQKKFVAAALRCAKGHSVLTGQACMELEATFLPKPAPIQTANRPPHPATERDALRVENEALRAGFKTLLESHPELVEELDESLREILLITQETKPRFAMNSK